MKRTVTTFLDDYSFYIMMVFLVSSLVIAAMRPGPIFILVPLSFGVFFWIIGYYYYLVKKCRQPTKNEKV